MTGVGVGQLSPTGRLESDSAGKDSKAHNQANSPTDVHRPKSAGKCERRREEPAHRGDEGGARSRDDIVVDARLCT